MTMTYMILARPRGRKDEIPITLDLYENKQDAMYFVRSFVEARSGTLSKSKMSGTYWDVDVDGLMSVHIERRKDI